MKSYRYLDNNIGLLGKRLDAAHAALARSKTKWAKNQWQLTINRLTFQWRNLPILHDGDAVGTDIPRWSIDYNWYEKSEEIGGLDLFDKLFHSYKRPDLHWSWENHREQRLAKAQ